MNFPVNRPMSDLTPEEVLGFYEAAEGENKLLLRAELIRRMRERPVMATNQFLGLQQWGQR